MFGKIKMFIRLYRALAELSVIPGQKPTTVECNCLTRVVKGNVPSNFFQYARKSIVSERHIFMPERLNFFHTCHPTSQDNKEISLDTRLMSLDLYIHGLHSPGPSPEHSGLISIKCTSHRDIEITVRQLETVARRFFATCAAAQPRSLEGTLVRGGGRFYGFSTPKMIKKI